MEEEKIKRQPFRREALALAGAEVRRASAVDFIRPALMMMTDVDGA